MLKRITVLVLGAAVLAACTISDDAIDDSIDRAEDQFEAIEDRFDEVDLPDEVESLWESVENEFEALLDAAEDRLAVDAGQWNSLLSRLESEVDDNDLGSELSDAVEQLRQLVDEFLSQVTT